ncbi:MAG: hypothetical protein K0Q50_2975 [Vampirovibrio sp.]|nr:hypothetical protein [Vampirovibrio sp.]
MPRFDLEKCHLGGLELWLRYWYRRGPRFAYYQQQLKKTSRLAPPELERFQNRKLQALITQSYQHIPYYRDLMDQLKLKPHDIQTKQDLRKLPFLTKKLVTDNYDKLIHPHKRNFLSKVACTSGTTGSPGKFMRSFDSINFEHAAVWRQWQFAGDTGKRRITLRGEVVVPMAQSEPPYWRYNPANQELLMCGFHLNEKTGRAYIEKILKFQPEILSSYPSNAYRLAHLFKKHRINYRFQAVFTSSEELSPRMKDYIEAVFQTQVYDWYGQSERVAAIAHCQAGRYHIQEDYSLVELVPHEQQFEIVGTHLFNDLMPLIRYRTGDMVSPALKPCRCGSSFRCVESISGRSCAYILTPEGYKISAANHIFHGVEHLLEAQLYQDHPEVLTIYYVPDTDFTNDDRQKLLTNAIANTSPRFQVILKEVSHIARGANGKFQSIVNLLAQHEPLSEMPDVLSAV